MGNEITMSIGASGSTTLSRTESSARSIAPLAEKHGQSGAKISVLVDRPVLPTHETRLDSGYK